MTLIEKVIFLAASKVLAVCHFLVCQRQTVPFLLRDQKK